MKNKIEIELCKFIRKTLNYSSRPKSCSLRTRVPNATLTTQGILTQSTASASTVTGSSDYSSYSNELYHIITGASSKTQPTSFQQIVNMIGPIDSNTLEIGQHVLLSTQENINFIHEIFRQVRTEE